MILDTLPHNAKILRPLGPTEELVLRFQKQADFSATANNIACHIQLRGPQSLTPEIFQQALAMVAARHPLLQASIAPTVGGPLRRWLCGHYVFVENDPPHPIPLQVMTNVDWREIMQRSFQEPWTLDGGALMRTYLINSASPDELQQDIIIWLSHTLADGLSLFSLMTELLAIAADLTEGRPVPQVVPQPLLRDIWAYSPFRGIHWGQVFKRLSHYITTPVSPRVFHPSTENQIPRKAAKTRYLQHRWSVQDSATIVAKAKAYQTSVGGLVGTALMLAIAESAPQQPNTIGLSSIVDLRRRANPPVPFDSMGHCASQVQTYYELTPDTPIGELAREVQHKVKHVLHSGISWDVGRLIRIVTPWLLHCLRHGPIQFPYSVVLSNIGRLQMPSQIGPFSISQCNATGDFSFAEGYIFLALLTFNGQMSLDWTFGRVAPELVEAYAARMHELLLTA